MSEASANLSLDARCDAPERPILFVTDEVFEPAHNGSCQVYRATAARYANGGNENSCLSFFRHASQPSNPVTRSAYAAQFAEHLLVPSWNAGATAAGKVGTLWRQILRWVTGNVFASDFVYASTIRRYRDSIYALVQRRNIRTVYLHKPHVVLLLWSLLPGLRHCRLVLDLHDDFVERALEYRRACDAYFAAISWKDVARHHAAEWVQRRLTHVNVRRSRAAEDHILARCDEIYIASREEFERYRMRPGLAQKLVHRPWLFPPTAPAQRRGRPRFEAGFIASSDVTNLDALMIMRNEILPRIRERNPDFRLLVAGSIAQAASRLLSGIDGVEYWQSPCDPAAFYASIGVVLVPVRFGTGVSIKVMEALAFGCPVISTSKGARGLSATASDLLKVADDFASFSVLATEACRAVE